MVLSTSCPKCHHQFTLTAQCAAGPIPCPCRSSQLSVDAPAPGGVAPAVSLPQSPPPMLSISITAASASALNGGHVVVNSTSPNAGPGPGISMCAMSSVSLPWNAAPAPAPVWSAPPQAEPLPNWTAAPAPAWPSSPWGLPPPPTTLNLRFCQSIRPQSVPAPPPPTPKGALYRLTGGGILHERGATSGASGVEEPVPVLLQQHSHSHPACGRGKFGVLPLPLPCACGGGGGGPEQSPSAPVSFVLPTLLVRSSNRLAAIEQGTPECDLKQLQSTTRALKTSGWYYEGYSWQESAATLKDAAPGTFLVRDSSDPRFLFSLSVQTDRGPTSVRLHYIAGGFRLDAEPHLAPTMPLFPCVLQLIEHYVASSRTAKKLPPPGMGTGRASVREQVWVDARGQMYSHILLTGPRRHAVPGLQHLARLAVHRQIRSAAAAAGQSKVETVHSDVSRLELPHSIREFLEDYPFTL